MREFKPEASTMSTSVSRDMMEESHENKVDIIFPFFDEIFKEIIIPAPFYFLLIIVACFQLFVTSLWPGVSGNHILPNDVIGKDLNIFISVFLFCSRHPTDSVILILFGILFIFVVSLVVTVGYELFSFSRTRHFNHKVLSICRVLLEFVPLICIVPISNIAGEGFDFMLEQKVTILNIFLFSSSFVFLAINLYIQWMMSSLSSMSPYLSNSPIAGWDAFFHFCSFSVPPLFLIISRIMQIFARWTWPLFVGAKICFNLWMIRQLFYFPLVAFDSEILCGLVYWGQTFLDITCLINFSGIDFPNYVYVIALVFGLFCGAIFMKGILTKVMKTVIFNLTPKALDGIEIGSDVASKATKDPKKWHHFRRLQLDTDAKKAILYLRIGLAHCSPFFLDKSLITFIAEKHTTSPAVYVVLTQYMSLFPCESRMTKLLYSQCMQKINLKNHHQFALYQIHKVMALRQSSGSHEITEKLLSMKRLTNTQIGAVLNFWRAIPSKPDCFYQLRAETIHLEALYKECLEKWPHNARFAELYSLFLIEGALDFHGGLIYKNRVDLIEQGKVYSHDLSFRSLVRSYPMYLKKNIVDVKGNLLIQTTMPNSKPSRSQGSIGSTSSQGALTTGSCQDELDADLESQLARSSFNSHRLRLAFQRSLKDRQSPAASKLQLFTVLSVTLASLILLGYFILYFFLYNTFADNMTRQLSLNRFRYGFDMTLLSSVVTWFKEKGVFAVHPGYYDEMSLPSTSRWAFNFTNDFYDEINRWEHYGEQQLELFYSQIIELATKGENVRLYLSNFLDQRISLLLCKNDIAFVSGSNASMRNILNAFNIGFRSMTSNNQRSPTGGTEPAKDWGTNPDLCKGLVNIPAMAVAFADLATTLHDEQLYKHKIKRKMNWIVMIVSCSFILLFSLSFILYYIWHYFKDIDLLLSLMQGLDHSSIIEASKLFKSNDGLDSEEYHDTSFGRHLSRFSYFFLVTVPVTSLSIYFAVVVFFAQKENDKFIIFNNWLRLGITRPNYIYETVLFTMISIAQWSRTSIVTYSKMMAGPVAVVLSNTLVERLSQAHLTLMMGDPNDEYTPTALGHSKDFDDINLKERCIFDVENDSFHVAYQCAPLNRGIFYVLNLATELLRNARTSDFVLDGNFYHLWHLANNHLAQIAYEASDILANFAQEEIVSFREILAALCFGGIIFVVVSSSIFFIQIAKLGDAYQGGLQLLRKIPPLSININPALMDFLLNRSGDKNMPKLGISGHVIHNSKSGIVCVNRNESIDTVNPALSGTFGYTPEQLLGQSLTTLLPTEKCEDVYHQMNLMRSGQCNLLFETHGFGITDNEVEFPVNITLLGINDPEVGMAAKSFVVILRDETELIQQQVTAEAAKKQSEHLLYQILPRDIVTRLNSGETDISFSVPSSTIIFIDIVKFSDYASLLEPARIMENLSMIFAKFDELLVQHNLLTKIKLIGDIYMAAGGLFTPDEPPVNHAVQTVQFGLDTIAALDDLNTCLDANLSVRVGVNTDGPLIAGVLGTDKPVFDIIGDAINVAARLQTNGIAGTVQISSSTYQLLHDKDFNIEKRGEIELKGKGKKMSYIVRGHTHFSSNNSSQNAFF